jgi:serine O-acetyltransferase
VRIGRGAIVGANAVVLHDVPPGAVVVGIPARILRRRTLEPQQPQDTAPANETGFEDTGT